MTVSIPSLLNPLLVAEWDDDMTYLYVDYPLYKKYMIYSSLWAVSITITWSLTPAIVPVPL